MVKLILEQHLSHKKESLMRLEQIEKDILQQFLNYQYPHLSDKINFDSLNVKNRIFTGVGFLTYLNKDNSLKITDENQSFEWGNIGAKLNDNKIDVGFLIYVKNGFIDAIEGYTYDVDWPNEITNIEFYEINQEK